MQDNLNLVALTGASGFIGRYFIEKLLNLNPNSKLKNLDLQDPDFDLECEFVSGDVRDRDATDRLCAGANLCIHLAAAHRDSGISRDEYFSVNEAGTQTLLQSMTDHGLQRLVFLSSVAVYNPLTDGPITEATVPDPQSPYGESKLSAERVIARWVEESPDRSALIVRPTVVIGPRNVANMYSLIDQIDRGRYMFNFGSGRNVKSVAVVMNLVEFVTWYVQNDNFVAGKTETFNFVDTPQLEISKTIDVIHDEIKRPRPRLTVPMPIAVMAGTCVDLLGKAIGKDLPISAARIRKLAMTTRFEASQVDSAGFQRRFSTEDGLRRMVRWFMASERGERETPVDWL